jgi:hypothetical protein
MNHSTKERSQQESLPSSVAECPLFKLPPELRNMIYRYAMISHRRVRITKSHGIPEPGLLAACKLVRSEAFEIFYRENDFTCVVRNYDSAPLVLVSRKFSRRSQVSFPNSAPGLRRHLTSQIQRSGTRNWENLVLWVLFAHSYVCCGFLAAPDDDPESSLISGLFETAIRVRE